MRYHLIEKHYLISTLKGIQSNSPFSCIKCNEKFEPPDTAQKFIKHIYNIHLEEIIKENQSNPELSSSVKDAISKNKAALTNKDTKDGSKERQNSSQTKLDVTKNRKSESQEGIDCPSDSSSADSEVLPPTRMRRTIHRPPSTAKSNAPHTISKLPTPPSTSTARQRMRDSWHKTSIDSQNYEIELLNKRIKMKQLMKNACV